MKMSLYFRWLLIATICFCYTTCQQLEDTEWSEKATGALKVEARSAEKNGIVYPMYLYVFSEDGKCKHTQTVENESENVRLVLPEGSYRVVAVSGIADGYVMQNVSDWDDAIQMSGNAGSNTPLMTGRADVKVGADTDSRLEIALSYSVTAIDVSLSNVPSDVAEIALTLSPFYTSMNMKGEYVSSGSSLKLACALDTSNQWRTKTRYLFPGSGQETVLSIWMKRKDGQEVTYGYTWKDHPKANQPYHLLGDYTDGLALNGTFVVTGWNEAEDVSFEFGAVLQSDQEKDDNSDLDLSALPEVGSIWNGSIVADVGDADESGADILLMSLDEWAIMTSQVEELTSGYSVNGISGWRLPTYDEAKFLQSCYSGENRLALNDRIAAYDDDLVGLDGEERYLCDKSGVYYTFVFTGGRVISKAGEKKSYYTRLVKTCHVDL